MLENKNRKLLLILSIVGVVISAIVCVPFTASKICLFEIILKYAVFGLAVAGITIYSEIIKYRDYTPTNKFTVVSSYVPLFSYVAALLFDTILNVASNVVIYTYDISADKTTVSDYSSRLDVISDDVKNVTFYKNTDDDSDNYGLVDYIVIYQK